MTAIDVWEMQARRDLEEVDMRVSWKRTSFLAAIVAVIVGHVVAGTARWLYAPRHICGGCVPARGDKRCVPTC